MLQFGMRLGKNPQQLITTTPRPLKLLKQLIARPDSVVTRGSTYDNRKNLPPSFFSQVITKYEGTRLGRQELEAGTARRHSGRVLVNDHDRSLPRSQGSPARPEAHRSGDRSRY